MLSQLSAIYNSLVSKVQKLDFIAPSYYSTLLGAYFLDGRHK